MPLDLSDHEAPATPLHQVAHYGFQTLINIAAQREDLREARLAAAELVRAAVRIHQVDARRPARKDDLDSDPAGGDSHEPEHHARTRPNITPPEETLDPATRSALEKLIPAAPSDAAAVQSAAGAPVRLSTQADSHSAPHRHTHTESQGEAAQRRSTAAPAMYALPHRGSDHPDQEKSPCREPPNSPARTVTS